MVDTSHINDADYWRARADALRAVADDFKDEWCRAQLLKCADDYDRMAQRAEERRNGTAGR